MTHRPLARLILPAALVLSLVSASSASDWPRFRGPNGTGASDDKGVPTQFSEQSGVLWKVAIPGTGNSSPVIQGGRLYLQTAPQDKERELLCLDAKTGKPIWTTKVPGGRGKIHQMSSLASATPAVDSERVYVPCWDGNEVVMHAFTLDGKPAWKTELGKFSSQHGAGASPIVHAGKVYFMDDQDGSAAMLCLDAATGKQVWKKERTAYRACYSTPFLMEKQGGTELIVVSSAGVTSYNPADGAVNWNFTWKFDAMALRTVSSPILAGDVVIATSGDGKGDRHMIAVRAGGKGDVSDSALVWENKKDFPYVPSVLTKGEHLYSVNDAGIAACHEAKTGREVWRERLSSKFVASPVLIDGKVYAADDKGIVHVYEAAPKFKLVGKGTLGEGVTASPAVADGRLYVRGRTHLFCIGEK